MTRSIDTSNELTPLIEDRNPQSILRNSFLYGGISFCCGTVGKILGGLLIYSGFNNNDNSFFYKIGGISLIAESLVIDTCAITVICLKILSRRRNL